MKPWLRWSLLAFFLIAMLVIQFIPGEGGPPASGDSQGTTVEP